jgi:hypothetical protein
MPLDLYAGPVARFLVGDFDPDGGRHDSGRDAYAVDEELVALAEARAKAWREKLNLALFGRIAKPLLWADAAGGRFLALRPSARARDGLTLWAAYLARPDLERPTAPPERLDADPAYAEAPSRNYYMGAMAVLECQAFAPSTENFIVQAEHPAGYPAVVTSTSNLRFYLDELNAASWRADREKAAGWLKAPTAGAKGDALLAAAREGYAAYDALCRFADAERVVILVSA